MLEVRVLVDFMWEELDIHTAPTMKDKNAFFPRAMVLCAHVCALNGSLGCATSRVALSDKHIF